MKRVIASICVGVLMLSSFGCGSSGQKASGTPSSSATAQKDKPYAGTTIRLVSMTGQVSDVLQNHIDDFTKNTGINIKLELYGETQLNQKLTTEFLAGDSTVDAFMISPIANMPAYGKNGWVENLDPYLKDSNKTGADYAWDDFSVDLKRCRVLKTGALGALPIYSSTQLMYYRKDIFKDKGITPPTNYDELIDACKKLNNPSKNFYAIAVRGEKVALTSQFSPFVYGFGAKWITDGVCTFDSPEAVKAVKFYGDLLKNYAPPGILSASLPQITQMFNSGQVAMAIEADALLSTITDPKQSSYADKVGVAPIPAGPTGRQSYKQVVWGVSMYSGSKHKDAAWEVLKFVTGKDVAVDMTPKGMPSFRKSVWTDQKVTSKMPADVVEAYKTTNGANTTNPDGLPVLTSVSEARDAIGAAVVKSIETGGQGADIESLMKDATNKVNNLLKAANEYGKDYPY